MNKLPIVGWGYRVVRHEEDGGENFQIREIYYDAASDPVAFVEDAHTPFGDTSEDLRWELELMMKAFDRPIIEMADLLALENRRVTR